MTRPSARSLWRGIADGGKADFMACPEFRMSYADLAKAVRRWLGAFDSFGLEEGDRIVLRTASEAALATGFVAALLDGMVPVVLGANAPDERLALFAAKTEAKAVILDAAWAGGGPVGDLPAIVLEPDAAARKGLFGIGKPDPLAGLPQEAAAREPRLPDDPAGLAYILFTSGTTASPGGVMIRRGNLFAQLETMIRLFGYDRDSRIFNDMALAHADGMIQGPVMACAGRCAVIRSGGFRLDRLESWLDRVRRERATHVIAVPTIWTLVDSYAAHDDYFDAPECRALLSVAAKLPEELWGRLERRFGRPVFNQYGLTETVASALYAGPGPEMGAFGTIGKPVDCEARIDPQAPQSGEGELQLRGEHIFPGYWRNAERTRDAFTEDGWMRTGDLVRRLDDGSYRILGRCKRTILTGGFLVSPEEIDEVMAHHPAVLECVTVAIEDEVFEEVPVSAVVCSAAIDQAALAAHARAHLEDHKIPKRFAILERIPQGDAGKPQLAELKDILKAQRAEPASTGSPAAPRDREIGAAVLALAAEIFCCDPALLSLPSQAGDVPGWDSFSQLNLLLAVERQFEIVIPASRIAGVSTIADMVRAVEDLRA